MRAGEREGADVPQLYLTSAAGDDRMRLLGFRRMELAPGESRRVTITAEPRLLARFESETGAWRIADGPHTVAVGGSAGDLPLTDGATLNGRAFSR